jgi:hypothetical protein
MSASINQRRPILSRSRLKGTDRWMDYVIAGLLFAGSAFGNIAAYNGGFDATFQGSWEPWQWRIAFAPFVIGVIQQLFLQWKQFANSDGDFIARLRNPRYTAPLLISAAPGLWVFWPVIADLVLTQLHPILAYPITTIFAILVVFGVDILQEELILAD